MSKFWYAAKSIFRHLETDFRRQMYEERIILLQAESPDSALKKAEKSAGKLKRVQVNIVVIWIIVNTLDW